MTTHPPPQPDLTKNQALVFDALRGVQGPLSAYEILDRLHNTGVRAPQQVYRALDKLLEFGVVHRLESINAFVACNHPDHEKQSMIAFAICEDCGQVNEFTDPALAKRLQGWAKGSGFGIKKTMVEVRGVCDDCNAA